MPFINLRPDCESACAFLPAATLSLWQKIALSTGQIDPVCCGPAWNLACHAVFHPNSRIFYLQSQDSLVMLCEMPTAEGGVCLMPMDSGWFFGQPLLGFGAFGLFREACEIFGRAYAAGLPPIFISGIRKGGREERLSFFNFSPDFDIYNYHSTVQCSASLEGGLDGWLGRRSANHRAKLRKAMRKALAQGVAFERFRPQNPEECASVYDRMIAIERQSWKGRGHCGMAEPPSIEFYAVLMEQYAQSHMGFVIFATRDGRDLGFVFGGAASWVYRGQQFSYIEDASELSIGNLLQFEQIRWLCELGFQRYDMGPISGPRMEYKRHWTEERRESLAWCLIRV